MFELCCTVRHCAQPLVEVDGGLKCSRGHHFDRNRSGYWSLLQPQDRRSLNPGDSDDAVLARQRWIERGFMAGLVERLQPWVDQDISGGRRTLDLGCGEGTFGAALFARYPDQFCGIDLSKRAVKLAARHWPQATWVWANADRFLPTCDESVQRVVSLFGRRPIEQIHRVLVNRGECIVAVPGEEDLIELRESVQQSGHRRSRWQTIVDEFSSAGFALSEHRLWRQQVELDTDAIADALAMTYRAVRHSQQARAEELKSMRVTLAADLLRLVKH